MSVSGASGLGNKYSGDGALSLRARWYGDAAMDSEIGSDDDKKQKQNRRDGDSTRIT